MVIPVIQALGNITNVEYSHARCISKHAPYSQTTCLEDEKESDGESKDDTNPKVRKLNGQHAAFIKYKKEVFTSISVVNSGRLVSWQSRPCVALLVTLLSFSSLLGGAFSFFDCRTNTHRKPANSFSIWIIYYLFIYYL